MSLLPRVRDTGSDPERRMLPAQLERVAESDRCDALLAKQAMEHTAMLADYASRLEEMAPSGKDAYDAFVKAYVRKAGQRLIGGRW